MPLSCKTTLGSIAWLVRFGESDFWRMSNNTTQPSSSSISWLNLFLNILIIVIFFHLGSSESQQILKIFQRFQMNKKYKLDFCIISKCMSLKMINFMSLIENERKLTLEIEQKIVPNMYVFIVFFYYIRLKWIFAQQHSSFLDWLLHYLWELYFRDSGNWNRGICESLHHQLDPNT